jgi:Ulp1 family protease
MQQNGHDCGIFTMLACRAMGRGRQQKHTQDDVSKFFRPLCALELAMLQLGKWDEHTG